MSMKRVSGWMLALFLLPGYCVAQGGAQPAEPEDKPQDPAAVCMDGFQPGEWGKLTDCLQAALKREEATLADLLSKAAAQAKQSQNNRASAEQTLKESSDLWTRYRASECDREQAFVAGRNHPDIGELTCKIRITGHRIEDLQFDDE